MFKRILGTLLAAFAAAPLGAHASILYGTEYTSTTPLYSVDQTTGAITSIGSTGRDFIGDLTSDTRAGSFTLWGVRINSNELLTFNGATGAQTSTVTMDSSDNMVSLAFNPVTGILYGNTSAGFGAPFDALYEINPLTGATTFIGRILFNNVYALGFDQSGNLFGVADDTDQLISISTATGNGSLIANLAVGFAFDIASRPEDNVMFLADSGTLSLYQLNTTTGATSLVGAYGSSTNIAGLAFGPAVVPEPGTLALLGLGLAGLAAMRRRKQ